VRDLKGTDKLQAVFDGKAWSMAELLFGLEALLDEDRRPLGERRAPSTAKVGCAMEFGPCPYDDYRFGKSMNLDALVQIKGNLKPVLKDVAAFRAAAEVKAPTWPNMFLTILDQLSGPASFYLRRRNLADPLPVPRAVGYKLAAGFFDVMMRLLRRDLVAPVEPVTAEAFLEIVDVEQALAGPAEVCGGPIRLIARATRVFLEGDDDAEPLDDPVRHGIAEVLATQLRLGLIWRSYDDLVEREVLSLYEEGQLRPKTTVVERALQERLAHHRGGATAPTVSQLVAGLPEAAKGLADALAMTEPDRRGAAPARQVLAELTTFGDGGLDPETPAAESRMVEGCAAYLVALAAFIRTQVALERELRSVLELPQDVGVTVGGLSLPLPRARRWFETMLGHKLSYETTLEPAMAFRNHHRRVVLDLTA